MDMTLSGATTPSQSGPGSHSNKGVLCIPKSSSITGTSPSCCLVLYPGQTLGESYLTVEIQSVYSASPSRLDYIYIYIYIYIYTPHMAEQKRGDQLEPTYSSSVRIRDVVLRIYLFLLNKLIF